MEKSPADGWRAWQVESHASKQPLGQGHLWVRTAWLKAES
jgi:hypothetical protein